MWKLLVAVAVVAGSAAGDEAAAQDYPTRPITMVVPFAAGGSSDTIGRIMADGMRGPLGQSVLIENVGGASGNVGVGRVARAAPDGYTLFFPAGAVLTANQHIYAKLNYDPDKDFVPVTNVATGPQVLAVAASSPYKSVKDLIEAARANPGALNFGHAGIGSQTHLAAENFISAAKIDVNRMLIPMTPGYMNWT